MNLKSMIVGLCLLVGTTAVQANDQHQQIKTALNSYIQGSNFSDKDKLTSAFIPEANLYLEKKGNPLWTVPIGEYKSWFKSSNKGRPLGRVGEVLAIDVEGDIATAKVEILMPQKGKRFVDMFLLKKLAGNWQILSKSAVGNKANNTGERILFIVSNAHFHGDSQLPAGASFGELVKAYDTFKQAGYTVDFVSPEGGAIPLSYINTAVPIHKKYLYNTDFMYAIGHTKSPEQVTPADYRAVHYIGGSNAMYGVAENVAIQAIAMEIYEKHDGIISSVCHGTAGIVNLKTQDGKYLVANKRISGYPDEYENQSKAYFKQFPFLIQETIEKRGGQFFFSARNTAHVEVDGRIVTGQNHLSSALVAERMIEILQDK